MKKLIAGSLIILLPFIFTGCGKEGPTDMEQDKTSITAIMNSSDWFNLTSYQENDSTSANEKGKGDTLISNPLWWRAIPKGGREWNIDISVKGDSAYVEWTLHNTGKFNIIGQRIDSTWFAGFKSLKETVRMDAIFKRTGNVSDNNRGWELKKLTGAIGSSDSIHTIQIDSVRIQCTSYPDTILTNALEHLFDKDNALAFASGEEVTVTLYTNTNDAEAYLHVFQSNFPWHYRIPMKNNGDNSYTNETVWHVQVIPGVRFAVFDLMRHNTIYDTEYAYDSDGWLYPYVVE